MIMCNVATAAYSVLLPSNNVFPAIILPAAESWKGVVADAVLPSSESLQYEGMCYLDSRAWRDLAGFAVWNRGEQGMEMARYCMPIAWPPLTL
jgi:hypothetical protein